MKRWIAGILLITTLLTLFPISTIAAERSKGGKLIALTFDDGPASYTKRLLDGLKARNVKVTFFMVGQNVSTYSQTVRRVYEEGHQIASHTYNHPTLSTQSDSQIDWQLNTTDRLLDECLGKDLSYILRPPYGDYTDRVLSRIGQPAIIWSVDTLDWMYRNSYSVRDRIISSAHDGAIVLMHDIHYTTIDGALWAIDALLAQGYEFVTVNELFRRRGVELQNGRLYYSCKPNGTDLGQVTPPTIIATPTYGGHEVSLVGPKGADVYYTTDGSDPIWYGKRYTGPIPCAAGIVIRAVSAFDLNGSRSSAATATVKSANTAPPVLSSKDGKIYIDNPNPGTDIRYTTDGSTPNQNSPIYNGSIPCFDGTLSCRVMGMGVYSNTYSIQATKNGNFFYDVYPAQWFYSIADRAVALKLFEGTGNYHFSPNATVTRAMFVTVLHRMMGMLGYDLSFEQSAGFADVPGDKWYTDAVYWAAEQGLVLGYGDQSFRPEGRITREQMCVILDRALALLEQDAPTAALTFADADAISLWARDSVSRMTALGIIKGQPNNKFVPTGFATRAEAAAVFLRLYDLVQ